MVVRGYRPLTIKQKKYELKKYFGTPASFENAWVRLMAIGEDYKRGYESNKINALIGLIPNLRPDEETYKFFLEKQKEWNEKCKEYYENLKSKTEENGIEKLKKLTETLKKNWENSRGTPKEYKAAKDYILCVLYVEFPSYIGRSVEFRTLQWRRNVTNLEQNYVTQKEIILNNYKKTGKKEKDGTITRLKDGQIRLKLPAQLTSVIRRMRSLINRNDNEKLYIFGKTKPLSQPAFSLYQKRLLGYTTNQLRRMMEQNKSSGSP